jgi:glycosyltransferase involved in cell wall biosynthesis
MRITFIITDLEPGGAEKCLTELVLQLDRSRYEPRVCVLQSRPPAGRTKWVDALAAAQVPVFFCNARSLWQAPWILWQLWWQLRSQAPDVVQTFLYHANVLGVIAARLAGLPVMVGVRVAEPKPVRRTVERWVYRFAQGIVFVSESVQRTYEQQWRHCNSTVIPNSVPIEADSTLAPADLTAAGIPAEVPVLLVVGRLHAQKGIDWLLTCLPALFAKIPHTLCIAGDGPERSRLEQQAKQLGVAERVRFLGWRADVPALLKRATCLLLPSRYEGMPNVMLEAMAMGTPVIATRAEGVAELLGPYAETLTVPFGDATAWNEKIVQLWEDPAARTQLALPLQIRVQQEFTTHLAIGRYEACWQDIRKK